MSAEELALLRSENERLRRGLEAVQDIPCGIPSHAVAVGCQRALAAQAVLGGWKPELWRGSVTDDAWAYAQQFVDETNERAGDSQGTNQ